jgi:hypothetical protein
MTTADQTHEQVAQRLAAHGRDALVERLRHAYTQAAEVHADVLSIDGDRLETMVQGAADRADGLQWRRALADVASGELGISITDALAHPAVVRAQELVGAPSYDDSLAALVRRPVPDPPSPGFRDRAGSRLTADAEPRWESMAQPAMPNAAPAAEPERSPQDAAADPEQPEDPDATQRWSPPDVAAAFDSAGVPQAATQVAVPLVGDSPEPDSQRDGSSDDDDPGQDEAPTRLYAVPDAEDDRIRVTAIHLGGVANLAANRESINLRLSAQGLDIIRGDDGILGRLAWSEIDTLEVPSPRGRRRRGRDRARLIVRTSQGDAGFEVPGLTSEELRGRIRPLLVRFGRR